MSSFVRHARNRRLRLSLAALPKWSRRRGAIALCGLLLLMGSGLIALSPATVLNVIALWGKYRATTGIAYAPGPRHSLDIYAPDPPSAPARRAGVFSYAAVGRGGDRRPSR